MNPSRHAANKQNRLTLQTMDHTLVLDRAVGLPERLPGSNAGERGSPREALVGVDPVLWQHYRVRSQG